MTNKKIYVEYIDLAVSECQQSDVMSWKAFVDLSNDSLCTVLYCCICEDGEVS